LLAKEINSHLAPPNKEAQSALNIDERVRTSVLPWKGQFSPQLIEYLLSCNQGDKVLDPFCGSGTVLYECALMGRSAHGIDINPAAIALASFSSFCNVDHELRLKIINEARSVIFEEVDKMSSIKITVDLAKKLPNDIFYRSFLLSTFGDKVEIDAARVYRQFDLFCKKLISLPITEKLINTNIGDGRFTGLPNNHFDLIITSPPYINVFNYHQNYRPIIEAFGDRPLHAAKAEIGSNRKNRQNRFLTVIQYCIDMQLIYEEMWRVLTPKGVAILVVGHSSKVRGVSFYNADLICKLVERSGAFKLIQLNKRSFKNRFGEEIYEDVLTFLRNDDYLQKESAVDIGREIGAAALFNSLSYCSDQTIKEEINNAYVRSKFIESSPRVS